jgi:hypothetical protein
VILLSNKVATANDTAIIEQTYLHSSSFVVDKIVFMNTILFDRCCACLKILTNSAKLKCLPSR